MSRIVGGILFLLLALPALRAEDKPKPATPAEQYQALVAEYQKAMNAYQEAARNAKTPEERQKVFQEKYPYRDKLAPKFIELAENNPKDPIAVDALVWVMTGTSGTGAREVHAKAVAMLLRDYIDSPKLAAVCQSLAAGFDPENQKFLQAVLEKNKNPDVQAEACLALAQSMLQRASIVKRLKEDPELGRRAEEFWGKATVEELKKTDLAELQAQSRKFFDEFADKRIGAVNPERLANLFRTLRFSGDESSEGFLRTVMKKAEKREVQGPACLTLAQVLKRRADEAPAAQAEKLRAESEKLFERAAADYADVKFDFRSTIGDTAKAELFDIRHLSVGKSAPEVKGEDQDGKAFSLADYKGKVVLLDFWSEF
jgi:hypothetical protein